MIEIRSLKPFCPVIAVARPDDVGSVIAAYGYTRDEVVTMATPHETAEAEALREAAEAQERTADAQSELANLEKELREAYAEASSARSDLDDEKRKRIALERERDQLRDQLSTLNRALLAKAG